MYEEEARQLPNTIVLPTTVVRAEKNSLTHDIALSYTIKTHKSTPLYTCVPITSTPKTVPSLFSHCIRALYLSLFDLEDIEVCWRRRPYDLVGMRSSIISLLPHLISELPEDTMPEKSGSQLSPSKFWGTIHPLLWGIINALIIPSTLPPCLRGNNIPLADPYLQTLQHCSILSTQTLSLLTCLSFDDPSSRIHLTDDALLKLRSLRCLTILDVSGSPITTRGIKRFAVSVRGNNGEVHGPSMLRILDLRRTFVDDLILDDDDFDNFRYLCGIDVRDTKCTTLAIDSFQKRWDVYSDIPSDLFYPIPTTARMAAISDLIRAKELAANAIPTEHALLFVNSLEHPTDQVVFSEKDHQDATKRSGVLVLTPNDTIVGYTYDAPGTSEENTARSSFVPLSEPKNRPPKQSRLKTSFRRPQKTIPSANDDDRPGRLYRSPPIRENHSIFVPKIHDTIKKMPKNVPGSHSSIGKRKRAEDGVYDIKRLKGPPLGYIFGSGAKSLSNRKL